MTQSILDDTIEVTIKCFGILIAIPCVVFCIDAFVEGWKEGARKRRNNNY